MLSDDNQREYLVTWAIDIYAESPEEAAREALRIQRDPDNIATVFEIRLGDESTTVDLAALDEEVA